MPGSTEEAIAVAHLFLRDKQRREDEQRKKAKKLARKVRKMRKLSNLKKK